MDKYDLSEFLHNIERFPKQKIIEYINKGYLSADNIADVLIRYNTILRKTYKLVYFYDDMTEAIDV